MKTMYWAGVGSAFCLGVITGAVAIRIGLEKKLRDEYAQREEMMQNSYQKALELQSREIPVPELSEIDLLEVSLDEQPNAFGEGILTVGGEIETVNVKDAVTGETVMEKPVKENPYHRALEAVETPVEMFVEGGINDYGISYIEEEEYLDEDGRFKGKIDILMDDHQPIFLMDGQPIDDWDKRVGDSILVDFYRLVPPGVDPILYVRNHRTDEDYEVVRVSP